VGERSRVSQLAGYDEFANARDIKNPLVLIFLHLDFLESQEEVLGLLI
jgi:hypothetical protein